MTAGYDPINQPRPGESETERLGPLPPRMSAYGSPAAPSGPPAGQPNIPMQPGPAGYQPPGAQPAPYSPTSSFPAQPPFSGGPAQPPFSGAPAQPPFSGAPAFPAAPASPTGGYTTLGPPVAPEPQRRRGGRLGAVAFVFTLVLLLAVGAQGFLLWKVNEELTATKRTAAEDQRVAGDRIKGLEERAKELEARAGNTLDAAAVAAAVTPSVFRVTAGRAGGTAFAIGKEPSSGGTDLLTNYHVVKDMYEDGGREVSLERRDARYKATVIRVDTKNDLALLHSDEKFNRLAPSTVVAKPGQPVVVIGAPLGLEDSVTAGVISAVRTSSPEGPFVQFDAPINPGNSGGPVVNAQRQVVGVATAKARNAESIGIAVPIDIACQSFSIC